jgi:hypothetical protein
MARQKKQISSQYPVVIAIEGLDYLHVILSQIRERREYDGVLLWDFKEAYFEDDFALLIKERHFEEIVRGLGIIRDAEESRHNQESSIRNVLLKHKLAVPNRPFEIADGRPSTSYLIMPHDSESGCLEHACLQACALPDEQIACATSYFDCLRVHRGRTITPNLQAKTMVHALIASHHSSPAMTLGQSAAAGIWNFEHPSLKIMLDFIQQMRKAAGLQ